jgi:transcriptional regulator with XRE-family HTH domain
MSKIDRTTPSRALIALSANLKTIAHEKGLETQEQIGREIGLNQKAVSRILNKEHEPQLDTLCQIADKLNLRESALLLPNLGAGKHLSNQSISDHLRPLIEQLIRLDNDGMLAEQVMIFLKMGIDMATHTAPQQDKSVKRGTQ